MWRPEELIDEAWRRLAPAHLVLASAVCALVVALLLWSAADLASAVALADARAAAGADVAVVSVPDGETLDAGACARSANNGSVLVAGADFGENTSVDGRWQPVGTAVPVRDVTLAALRTWWPDAPLDGSLIVGRDLRDSSGLDVGMTVTINGELLTVGEALPQAVRPDLWQASLLRVVPAAGPALECWIRAASGTVAAVGQIAATAFPDNHPIVVPFAQADELSADPRAMLANSPGRFGWLMGGGAALALWFLVELSRREESGVYRTTGTSWPELGAMSLVQTVILVVAPAAFATVATVLGLLVLSDLPTTGTALWFVLQPVVLAVLMMCAGGPILHMLSAAGAQVDSMRT